MDIPLIPIPGTQDTHTPIQHMSIRPTHIRHTSIRPTHTTITAQKYMIPGMQQMSMDGQEALTTTQADGPGTAPEDTISYK